MEEQPNNEVTLSTGVTLRVKTVNPMILQHMLRHNMPPAPKAPKVYIEAKGREEENPDHPEYRAAVDEYDALRSEMVNRVLIGLGTEVAASPNGMGLPEDKGWVETLEAIGMSIPDDGLKRYIFWVQYWACRTAQDTVAVLRAVSNGVATPEVQVAEAAEFFRNREGRRADRKLRDKASR